MGPLKDCEAVVDAFLAQPVNSVTALGFAVAGSVVLARTELAWVGWALMATGAGSFLFHGPMPSYAEWAHDTTLAWLLLVIGGVGLGLERWAGLPGLLVLGAVLFAYPALGDPAAVGLSVVAIGMLVKEDRTVRTLGPLALVGLVAIVGRLGATGGPLCEPDSMLQPHALWHLGSAVAVAWWAWGSDRSA